jgi:hypothetical protein
VSRRFGWLYVLWIVLCAILFVALARLEDPSRPQGRVLSLDAGRRALAVLRERDPVRFHDYEVVHVARARAGEGGKEDRWIVLCDRVPHTAMREGAVVELDQESGKLLRIRKPEVRGSSKK